MHRPLTSLSDFTAFEVPGWKPPIHPAISTGMVILDTNVIRSIVVDGLPTDAFVALVREGGTIHLADGAIVEILSWLHSADCAWSDWERARIRVDEFIDPEVPLMMGGREVLAQAGLLLDGPPSTFLPHEQVEENRHIWRHLMSAKNLHELSDIRRIIRVDGRLSHLRVNASGAPKQVARQKDSWVKMFERYGAAAKAENFSLKGSVVPPELLEQQVASLGRFVDARCTSSPPASLRMDAMLRVHTLLLLRSLQKKHAYNAKNNQNDAFDFDLYRYLALPAAICTSDAGVFNDLRAAHTWQLDWVVKPDDLKDRERRRQILELHWPARK